ncbi:MAG: ribosome small subunit-dependent GTPase A [Phycisphaerales bacterium]|nr:ribosome small subunit-dependent GTPase A [Hyphomonadaceae bacterium]
MINDFGWSDALQAAFAPHVAAGLTPARVVAHHRGLWRLVTDAGECAGRMSGRFAAEAAQGDHPVVGDWLAISREVEAGDALIHALMPRKSAFARRAAGGVGVQVVAANVDIAFLVAGLNNDLNPRRLERYLVAARDSGASPVVVLTKADLSLDVDGERQAVVDIAAGAPVVTLSALTGDGLHALDQWLQPGVTAALLGSSGAGKSTLLNALAGQELMSTGAVREDDDRGRHTTTHRELFRLPGGALLIDTPGMRELGLVADEAALDESFADILALMPACKFSDCTHASEPGCAILAALGDGSLSAERWQSYLKLQREVAFVARKDDSAAEAANRAKWKSIHKVQRAKYKHRRDNEGGSD